MLNQRKKVQIVIFPKIFNVLSFYSKGQYAVQICVVQQTPQGKLIYTMPQLIQNKSNKIQQSKKAQLQIYKVKKQLFFVTEQFNVTYNEESVALHTMAVFKLQHEPGLNYKTYIDFKLNVTRYKIEPNAEVTPDTSSGHIQLNPNSSRNLNKSRQIQPRKKKVVVQVDKRRVYINNLMDLNQFKRIVFSQCQYFSFLDTYIGSSYLGTRFRFHKFQLSDFNCSEDKQKIDYFLLCQQQKIKLTQVQSGNLLAKETGYTVQQFRIKFNTELDSAYSSLRRKMVTLLKLYEQESIYTQGRQLIRHVLQNQVRLQTILKTKQQLANYYGTQSTQQLYLEIYKQTIQYCNYLQYLWKLHLNLIQNISYRLFSVLIQNYLIKQNMQKQKTMMINMKIDSELRKIQQNNFLKRRKQVLDQMRIYEEDDFYHPFIMVQNFQDNKETQINTINYEINSLVVFIHGYQGSDYDLEKAKNYLCVYSPHSYGLLIKSIQDQIDQNIEHLGQNVAQEIKAHISSSVNGYRKISLIGYSLGGVIARQAVKHLAQFKDKMNLLITFASPHLGVSINNNKLVGTGVWYLINFEKVKNLKQLNCEKTEYQNQQAVTLQKLSGCQGLRWFKKFIVVSSEQDNFVPHHSSRIGQNVKSQLVQNMAKNILSRVRKIQRVQVWFDVDHNIKTFDKILGRRAHIQFLQNRIFLDMFFRLYGKQF